MTKDERNSTYLVFLMAVGHHSYMYIAPAIDSQHPGCMAIVAEDEEQGTLTAYLGQRSLGHKCRTPTPPAITGRAIIKTDFASEI